ncbi:MAG: hypothetical protein J1F23_03560 [Oscillospiraceae bacterium]|nr:hypothetical protein [Oscillospiraceae bacterium]
MKFDVEKLFHSFIRENNLDIQLSYIMPSGYEDAFGTFDITVKTLFLNKELLEKESEFKVLFYFYHELRHALQYIHTQKFPKPIRESINYVILYNGLCFKLVDGEWKTCRLVGNEEYFSLVYENLPYELDANLYARDMVKALLPKYTSDIESLYCSWLPQKSISSEEFSSIFRQIDSSINSDLS